MQDVLDRALESYRCARMFEQANRVYAALWEDPVAWRRELAERASWDAALMDDLDPVAPEELESWGPETE
jgi:hypothetical protein